MRIWSSLPDQCNEHESGAVCGNASRAARYCREDAKHYLCGMWLLWHAFLLPVTHQCATVAKSLGSWREARAACAPRGFILHPARAAPRRRGCDRGGPATNGRDLLRLRVLRRAALEAACATLEILRAARALPPALVGGRAHRCRSLAPAASLSIRRPRLHRGTAEAPPAPAPSTTKATAEAALNVEFAVEPDVFSLRARYEDLARERRSADRCSVDDGRRLVAGSGATSASISGRNAQHGRLRTAAIRRAGRRHQDWGRATHAHGCYGWTDGLLRPKHTTQRTSNKSIASPKPYGIVQLCWCAYSKLLRVVSFTSRPPTQADLH
jgi:hypothetical protein